jgi:hypothetical protein
MESGDRAARLVDRGNHQVAMTRKRQPEVDEAEVDRIIALLASFTPKQTNASRMTPEARADVAYEFAVNYAKFHGSNRHGRRNSLAGFGRHSMDQTINLTHYPPAG